MVSAADVRHRIEYAGFRLAAWIFAALPVERASAVSGAIWRILGPRTHRHGRAVNQLQRAFPDKTARECEAIARDVWETLGRIFAEGFHLNEIFSSDRIDISIVRGFMTPELTARGVVICAAHQSNWEVTAMSLVHLGLKPTGVYQRVKNPYVDAFVRQAREPFYPAGLFAKGPASALPTLRNLQRGGCYATLADVRDFSGVTVPFFDRPAPTTPLPATIARMFGVPMIAYFIERLPGVRFRLTAEQIPVPRTDDKDADIKLATANLMLAFERSIRQRPEQWMWTQRRWG